MVEAATRTLPGVVFWANGYSNIVTFSFLLFCLFVLFEVLLTPE